jgi:hypothetical protein
VCVVCGGDVRFGALCNSASSSYMMRQYSCFLLKKIESYCLPASKQTHRHTSYLNNSIVVQYKGISILETAEE